MVQVTTSVFAIGYIESYKAFKECLEQGRDMAFTWYWYELMECSQAKLSEAAVG